MSECPVSTAKGVKAADVAWCSEELWAIGKDRSCFPTAPEICVEVLSPSNTDGEISEKRTLYFEAGAAEVWICSEQGAMSFFVAPNRETPVVKSRLCPEFPALIQREK